MSTNKYTKGLLLQEKKPVLKVLSTGQDEVILDYFVDYMGGWLKVPKSALKGHIVSNKSSYKGRSFYLHEDEDMQKHIQRLEEKGFGVTLKVTLEDPSRVRKFPLWKGGQV